jgi:Uma2 family endonuclease
MTLVSASREFEPGTLGWTVDDLSDPQIGARWSAGRYELVEGVLTVMAPQGLRGVDPLSRLRRAIERHLYAMKQGGILHIEVDLMLGPRRVPRPDMLFLTPEQQREQKRLEDERGITDVQYCPVLVTPLLVVESLSPDNEDHDRITKLEWYAKARIPFYWMLTSYQRSLVCLRLDGTGYVDDVSGRENDVLRPTTFPGLTIDLAELWKPD